MTKNDLFISQTISAEVVFLQHDLTMWKHRTDEISSLLYPIGKPGRMIEDIRKRISKLEICLELLTPE